ncbi:MULTISPECIES: rhamnose ABC transporter substrate-binding protein [unclassified Streptomyces]|uniref:rhamnose ABC transporter substrate-binding protein n=1 Tax=unclassified Streptomyces TaxID=2593676 RepID=UPI0001C1C53D|nr:MULTISPECIES: rhamnose ABC transporter substrate-binding protein [unclassified Streptomyces]AEN10045.1 rhamnose ABC transporter, periplasmic rhamnose-binding protein [Streptomyces sp. SirexAA-E]MYR67093.1 rhamnose ABC transporter substrate-binding protein [Streptomyces sp. SID4939]MYS03978.1 rhamnose ABC transporter substrate-binding protein [Streptomyces sp. SID4940]MYT66170.1 rhamnose ABC transporter substrate-binding protein [Streptomyces sp. SID8357]MYT88232.1 rhamnose ABC transporter s
MMLRNAVGRRAVATAATAVCLALSLTACSGTTKDSAGESGAKATGSAKADPDAPLKKGLKLAFLPKQINNPYEKILDEAGIAAAKEYGGTGKEVGPSDANASSQVSYINTLIQQRQDAILIAANDPNAVCGPLKQAMKKDIKVVAYDSDTAKDCRQLFINQAGSEQIGRSLVQHLAEQIGHKGKIAILSATQNATNQNTWIEYMKEELKLPAYKDMELVKVAYGDDADQKSFQQTQGLLQAYPDLKGIISPTTVGIAAAARYLGDSSYKGKVVLNGLGTPNQMRAYVKNGTVEQFSLWNPEELGYLASYAAAALASGQITGAEGETFTAGELGEYTVGKDGEVILGEPTVFDAKNIDRFDF